jgi:hypothetical protein
VEGHVVEAGPVAVARPAVEMGQVVALQDLVVLMADVKSRGVK